VVVPFIDLSNELFDRLYKSELFNMIYKGADKSLSDIYNDFAGIMKEDISKIENLQKKIIYGSSNKEENILELLKLTEFHNYTEEFFYNICDLFKSCLTDEILESKEAGVSCIEGALDKLFYDNGFELINDTVLGSTHIEGAMFFKLPGMDTTTDELPKGQFPVFESKNASKMSELRKILEDNLKYLIKNVNRVVPYRTDDDEITIQAKKIAKKGEPIYKDSLISIVDTSVRGKGRRTGLWFCYDGVYFREYFKTKYVAFNSIIGTHLKKDNDPYSSLFIDMGDVKFKRSTFEFKDRDINKDKSIEILQRMKEVVENN
jgi:hypothetical protein